VVTLANSLTLIRIPMAALLWLHPENHFWIAGMVAAAALSDVLDGRVARFVRDRRQARGADPGRIGQAYAIGSWLDPLCDKTFVLSTLAVIAYGLSPSVWLVVLIATREIALAPLALLYGLSTWLRAQIRFDFRAGAIGKLATVAQFLAVTSLLFYQALAWPTAIAAAALGAIAAIYYLQRAVWMARWIANNGLLFERWLEIQRSLRTAAHGRRPDGLPPVARRSTM